MSNGSNHLASRFEQAGSAFIALIAECTPEQWQTVCPDEGWPVGAIARHVAGGMQFHAGHIIRMARGRPVAQVTMDQIHESNRENETANPNHAEALAALRANRDRLVGIIRHLSDEQLALSQPVPFFNNGETLTTRDMIERIATGHVRAHMDSVRAVVDGCEGSTLQP
ncbi:MAG TPA: DinB family protein [Thermomicrobiales bacterium]|nr:DinB family protein [Thermomicrobiales bacterium]